MHYVCMCFFTREITQGGETKRKRKNREAVQERKLYQAASPYIPMTKEKGMKKKN